MAFPPNYNQERNNRARATARKALNKQLKREEKAAQRKQARAAEQTPDIDNTSTSTSEQE
jgi:hypothetical protein